MTSFIGDGEAFYRVSKKLLTTDSPALVALLAAKDRAIKNNLLKKEQLEEELAEISDILKKDNLEKGYITRAIGIIEKNRKLQKTDLLAHETFLQRKIKTLIGEIDTLDEEAIVGKANNSAQKKVLEEQLRISRSELTNLQKNLKNIDTPTKAFGIW